MRLLARARDERRHRESLAVQRSMLRETRLARRWASVLAVVVIVLSFVALWRSEQTREGAATQGNQIERILRGVPPTRVVVYATPSSADLLSAKTSSVAGKACVASLVTDRPDAMRCFSTTNGVFDPCFSNGTLGPRD